MGLAPRFMNSRAGGARARPWESNDSHGPRPRLFAGFGNPHNPASFLFRASSYVRWLHVPKNGWARNSNSQADQNRLLYVHRRAERGRPERTLVTGTLERRAGARLRHEVSCRNGSDAAAIRAFPAGREIL